MKICGLERLSLVDFPGKACAVVFTYGCNFRCPFCHNSGLILGGAHELTDEVFSYLEKRKGLLDAVCISGGEPTQMKDLEDFIVKVRNMGYKIKLDTNGTNPDVLERLIEKNLLDYVAMDIKNSPSKYAETAGISSVDIEKVKRSKELLMSSGIDYEFRTTLVSNFHTMDSILEMGEFIRGAKKLYLQRFVSSQGCMKDGLGAVSIEEAKKMQEKLSSFVESVSLRGYV